MLLLLLKIATGLVTIESWESLQVRRCLCYHYLLHGRHLGEAQWASQVACGDLGLEGWVRSCHLLTNRWRLLCQLLKLGCQLKVHLLILLDVLINPERRLRVVVYLVDLLWRLLLRQLCRQLSLTRSWFVPVPSCSCTCRLLTPQ